jgi:tRNA(Ile)-lysidine synthase
VKYILAISGGVDSRVLLDLAADAAWRAKNLPDSKWPSDFVIAHFDHGIRGAASHSDAEFVRNLAETYGLKFFLGQGNLPADCGEELAREKRYEFLRKAAAEFGGAKIVTAHHQDDLLETALINLTRGTGWRGLAPMTDSTEICRPLLNYNKAELTNYALSKNLAWREDATNQSPRYLRNRVRDLTAQLTAGQRRKLLELIKKQRILRGRIEAEDEKILDESGLAKSVLAAGALASQNVIRWAASRTAFTKGEPVGAVRNIRLAAQRWNMSAAKNRFGQTAGKGGFVLPRYFFTMLPENAALELLRQITAAKLTRPQLKQFLIFIKVARPAKCLNFRNLKITAEKRDIRVNVC